MVAEHGRGQAVRLDDEPLPLVLEAAENDEAVPAWARPAHSSISARDAPGSEPPGRGKTRLLRHGSCDAARLDRQALCLRLQHRLLADGVLEPRPRPHHRARGIRRDDLGAQHGPFDLLLRIRARAPRPADLLLAPLGLGELQQHVGLADARVTLVLLGVPDLGGDLCQPLARARLRASSRRRRRGATPRRRRSGRPRRDRAAPLAGELDVAGGAGVGHGSSIPQPGRSAACIHPASGRTG